MNKSEKVMSESLSEYIRKNHLNIGLYSFFILFSYSPKLFHTVISIDTESIISVPDGLYHAWISMGRFGIILLKKLFGTYWFNPYVASVMLVVMMLASGFVWMYLFSNLFPKNSGKYFWVFPTIFLTSPLMAEQSSFLLQAYEVTFCIGLIGLALILFYKGLYESKIVYYIFTSLCLIICFATYQSTVILFVSGAIATFLAFFEKDTEEKNIQTIKTLRYWGTIGKLILVFTVSYFIFFFINKIILFVLDIPVQTYITEQVRWGKDPLLTCLHNVLSHVKDIILGKTIYYTPVLTVVLILHMLYTLYGWKMRRKGYYIYFLASLALYVCPFIMTILLGGVITERTEWTIPFVNAFLVMYLINKAGSYARAKGYSVLTIVIVTFAFAFGMQQSLVTVRLFYTEHVKYQEDVILAAKISDRIEKLDLGEAPEAPVIFIGARKTHATPFMYKENEINLSGRSMFSISFSTLHGTFVMNNFMKAIGYDYQSPSEEQIGKAEIISQNMGIWPDTDSVRYEEGVIVIRLS